MLQPARDTPVLTISQTTKIKRASLLSGRTNAECGMRARLSPHPATCGMRDWLHEPASRNLRVAGLTEPASRNPQVAGKLPAEKGNFCQSRKLRVQSVQHPASCGIDRNFPFSASIASKPWLNPKYQTELQWNFNSSGHFVVRLFQNAARLYIATSAKRKLLVWLWN